MYSIGFDIFARDRASQTFNKAGDAAGKSASKMQKSGEVAGKILMGVGVAAVVAGKRFADMGSDQAETLNKSSVIFGKNAADIERWGSTAWRTMGLSKTAAVGAAAGFGDMFSQLGFAGDQAAGMAKKVVQLSADLGSFNNLPTAEVADMMSAAFRGEYDSLQRLIPNINAARVESEAMAMTGKKTAKELTAQEKAAATLAIVTKDGARAQGDFARTSGGAANQAKIFQARLDDAQAALGTRLTPALATAYGWGIKTIDWVSRNGKVVAILGGAILTAVAAVWAINAAARAYWATQMALNIVLTANPIGLVIVGLVALGAALVLAYKKSSTFRSIVQGAWTGIGNAARWMWNNAVAPVIRFLLNGFSRVAAFYAAMLRGLARVPGFGWAAKAASALQNASNKAAGLASQVRNIPSQKSVSITVSARVMTGRIKVGDQYVNVGMRERGGPVRAGLPYVVGERRPELFVPDSNGTILPSVPTGGAGGTTVFQVLLDGRILGEYVVRNGRTIQQGLLRVKSQNGGRSLGLA